MNSKSQKRFYDKKIIVMSGFPGSGKSTLAKKIAEKFGFLTVKTSQEIIKKRMSKFTQKDNDNETHFQAWQRVFSEFKKDEKKGLISWPDGSLNIDIISHEDAYEKLA